MVSRDISYSRHRVIAGRMVLERGKSMYKCEDCGALIRDEDLVTAMDGNPYEIECPECHGTVVELNECKICGAPCEDDICEDCEEIIRNGLNAIVSELQDVNLDAERDECLYQVGDILERMD